MKNSNSGNPPLKADGGQGDGKEPTAQHEKNESEKVQVYSSHASYRLQCHLLPCRE